MNAARTSSAGTWLLAGATATSIAIAIGLIAAIIVEGASAFWPRAVERIERSDGTILIGEVVVEDAATQVLRTSELHRIGEGYVRLARDEVVSRTQPADAVAVEFSDGRRVFAENDAVADGLAHAIAAGSRQVEALHPNALGPIARCAVFVERFARFVGTPPDASNLAGGVLPALVGTLTLVLLMSIVVMPLGIATAIYLHERRGRGVGVVRRAIDTLAGIPAIVYGVLGLGLFVHGLGAGVDQWLFADRLPVPTFGGGGLLWAALTLALLTLPVVAVSVEEGLARIPSSLATASLALGATREETLWRVLLPAARPAVLTGLVLAISRAAGSVAPLMLVGMVKLAPASPIDGTFPYLHPSRQFMHLGFAVYDAALASPDALRGAPRAYACAMLLVAIVFALNLSAIVLRNRLRERYRLTESWS